MTRIDRRQFLDGSAAGALALLGLRGIAGCNANTTDSALADTGPALPRRIPASLLTHSRAELDISLRVLSGKLPSDIYGHLYITSPLPWGDGTHVFNGDGMLYRFDFGDAAVGLRTRLAKTPCYYADQAAAGTDMAFRNAALARFSPVLGFRNQVNTTPVPMGDRLILATDGGRPYEVDPASMEVVTPVGAQSEWRPSAGEAFAGKPFQLQLSAAHPYWDEHTRQLFTIGYGLPQTNNRFTEIVRWDGTGQLERFPLVLEDGNPVVIEQSAHQFAVTAGHVLVMECAVLFEGEQLANSNVSRAQLPSTVLYLVRRADLTKPGASVTARKIVIPRESAHIMADYDDSGDRVVIYLANLDATDLTEWLRPDDTLAQSGAPVRAELRGLFGGGADIGRVARHVIDTRAAKVVEPESLVTRHDVHTWSVLFHTHRDAMPPARFEDIYFYSFGFSEELLTKRILDLYREYPHRDVAVSALPTSGKPPTIFRVNARDMSIADGYAFPAGRIPTSPQFVPRRGSSGSTEGYLACVVLSDDVTAASPGTEIWLLDAKHLAKGPICRLAHPEMSLPFTLHTTWMAEAKPRTAAYRVSPRQDFGAELASQTEDVKALFEQKIFPHFPA